jgi:hypothetical protein
LFLRACFYRPNFIKYGDSEHRNIVNILGKVHLRTGTERPEGE